MEILCVDIQVAKEFSFVFVCYIDEQICKFVGRYFSKESFFCSFPEASMFFFGEKIFIKIFSDV
jgi:hypothetical protein